MLDFLQKRASSETDDVARQALLLALANLQLTSPQADVRLKAVALLGQSDDPDVQAKLTPFAQAQTEPDARVRAAAEESLNQIKHRLMWGDLLGQAFMGLSLGSVLLLAALGLAITYGLLGVHQHGARRDVDAGSVCHLDGAAGHGAIYPAVAGALSAVALPVAFC
jgi:urea transport system permease protein